MILRMKELSGRFIALAIVLLSIICVQLILFLLNLKCIENLGYLFLGLILIGITISVLEELSSDH